MDEERLSYSGKDIINENLRQKCIYKANPEKWWEYIKRAHKLCYSDFTDDCSVTAHKDLKLDFAKTTDCVSESFNKDENSNLMLKED